MNLDKYTAEKATHLLRCRHAIGSSGLDYSMKCTVLGKTNSGKTKIVVFGNRYWKYKSHIKKIRYVNGYKVRKK